ncbi:MAG: hypothetical protein JXR41_15075 [Bacteroidales bacterium]|nr:hypothetical protein [Bacteroidales bacterium]
MVRTQYISFILLLCCLHFDFLYTQEIPQAERDSIFITALRDELKRSMEGLEDPEAGKPFFISYSLLNGVLTSSEAVLGALTESSSVDIGDWYLRLMMGSYARNDENFIDPLANPDIPGRIQIACPVEPDYWGIRKAFWWNTDNVFRSAVRNYKNKLGAIKEFPLDAETDNLADYTKADAVKISIQGSVAGLPRQKAENLVKDVSSVFRDVKDIYRSAASLTAMSATVYIINTEGSEIRIPLNLCLVNITVQVKTGDEEILSDNLTYMAPFFSFLPPADTLKKDALRLGEYLLQLKNATKTRTEYNGPVLLFNHASANAFLYGLFDDENKLIAIREPLVYNMKKSMSSSDVLPFEARMDKRIISKNLTVTALPHLQHFNGIHLMGHVPVDAEGIIPPDEIVLVQDGVLKNLLNNRIPTPKMPQSNGHHRIGVRTGGFTFQDAPSVISISATTKFSHAGLIQHLISIGKEKGLESVYIIRPLIVTATYSPLCFYRLDILSGEQTLVKPLQLNQVTMNDLNKRIYVSDSICVTNVLFGSFMRSGGDFLDGIPVSMIVPDALLLEEVALQPSGNGMGYGFPMLD